MQEIRFHGRGGQGTVVAAILLAKAFFQAGFYVQSFPSFGVERRGAPVEAYLRIDSEKILVRKAITTPDHILVQDLRLMQTTDVTHGMQAGGWALLNAPAGFDFAHRFTGVRLASIDATRIAMEKGLGTRTHPMINTAMIGAFARIMEMPPIDTIMDAIKADISVKPEKNALAALQAFESVIVHETPQAGKQERG
jgi:pyruvate ferredoxin oxidoreductase gamma subunit/2-oxoisovalerate ferredoxin oxidoreductase gamma subunit